MRQLFGIHISILATFTLQYFRIRFRFRRDIRLQSCLRGVHATIGKCRFRFYFRRVQFISAVCCTLWGSSLQCVAHRWYQLRGGMHTAETTVGSNISVKSEPNSTILYFSLCIRGGLDEFESWKNRGQKSRDTLPLSQQSAVCSTILLPALWSCVPPHPLSGAVLLPPLVLACCFVALRAACAALSRPLLSAPGYSV